MGEEMIHSGVVEVMNRNAAPVSATLTRGAKGEYRWEVKAYAQDVDTAIAMVKDADQKLCKEYLTEEKPNEEA